MNTEPTELTASSIGWAPDRAETAGDEIVLPDWGDPTSVAAFIVAAFTSIAAILTATGVIIPSGVSASVQGWASVAGFLIAGAVAAFNQWRITSTHKAAIRSGHRTRTAKRR